MDFLSSICEQQPFLLQLLGKTVPNGQFYSNTSYFPVTSSKREKKKKYSKYEEVILRKYCQQKEKGLLPKDIRHQYRIPSTALVPTPVSVISCHEIHIDETAVDTTLTEEKQIATTIVEPTQDSNSSESIGGQVLTMKKILLAAAKNEATSLKKLLQAGTDGEQIQIQSVKVTANMSINVISILLFSQTWINGTPWVGTFFILLRVIILVYYLQLCQLYLDSTEILHYLLTEKNADANVINDHAQSALHICALKGNVKVAEVLLEHGAAVDLPNERRFKQTPLHLAALAGQLEMVRLLIKHDAKVDRMNDNPRGGTRFVVSMLLIYVLVLFRWLVIKET